MKITRRQLRQIIQEELLREHKAGGSFHTHTDYPPKEWPQVEKTIEDLQKEVDLGRPKSGDDDYDAKMTKWEKKSDMLSQYKTDLADSKERHGK